MPFLRIFLAVAAVLSSNVVLGANDDWTWSLVFDAGSTGTRLQLFKIRREAGKSDVFQEFIPANSADEQKLSLKPGLSAHLGNLANVRTDVEKLLKEAARWVPKNKQASTPVRLGATAGLRLAKVADQTKIIDAAKQALADKTINPFKSYGAFILSGEEEGLFGWLGINYFLGNFDKAGTKTTVGALDLGGASTQIAYQSPGQVLEEIQSAIVNGNDYRIFATSFLKFGNDQVAKQVFAAISRKNAGKTSSKTSRFDNPCQCVGFEEENNSVFFKGTGKWDECAALVKQIMHLDTQPCVFTGGIGRCSFLGKYLAPMASNFYAFSSYFYAASGLGLLGWNDVKKLSPDDFKTAGKTWCSTTKTAFSDKYKKDYCRQSVYIYHLLAEAYHFKPDDKTSITFGRKINGFKASWSLGLAMSYSASSSMVTVPPTTGLDPPVCQRKNMVKPGYRCAANEYNSRAEVEALCKRTATCTGYTQVGLTSEKGAYYLYGPAPVDEKLHPRGKQHGAHQCYKRYKTNTGDEFRALSWKGACHVGPHASTNYLCQDIGACRKSTSPKPVVTTGTPTPTVVTTGTSTPTPKTTPTTRRKTPTAPTKICKSVGDPHIHPFVKPPFTDHTVGWKTLYQKLDLIVQVYQRRWVGKTSGGPVVASNTAVRFSSDGGKTYTEMSKGEVINNKNPVFNIVGHHGMEATSQKHFPNYFLWLRVTARDFKAVSGSTENDIIYDVHVTTSDYDGATGQCVEGKRRRLGDNSGGVAYPTYPTGSDVKVTKAEAEQACASIVDLALRANCVTDIRMYNDPKAPKVVAAAYVSVERIDDSLAKEHRIVATDSAATAVTTCAAVVMAMLAATM